MVDENEREEAKGSEMPEDTPPPADTGPAGGAPVESGSDAAADAGHPAAAAMPPGGYPGSAKPQGGGIGRWIAGHKIAAGVAVGAMVVALMVGMFFIGYAVAKPCHEPDRRVPVQEFQQPMQQPPGMQSTPTPGPGEGRRGRLDVFSEFREEIEDVIAAELGITGDELRDEIEGGKTIAEIAEEKGISSEDLTAAVAAEIVRIADELAADGEISDAQVENIKDQADVLAERFVERGYGRFSMPSE